MPAPRASRLVTLLAAGVLLGFAAFVYHLHVSEPRLGGMADPERALALVVGRTLDVETALAAAPAWERRLYGLTLSESGREMAQAIAWYEELADFSLAPGVDLRLAILRGEAGRRAPLARALGEWEARGEPLAAYAAVVTAAYLAGDHVEGNDVESARAALGQGWFADVLALRLAVRLDEPGLGEAARRSIVARAGPLLWRLRALTLLDLALLAVGVAAFLAWRRRPLEARRAGGAPLPPPWPLGRGVVALVRGGALSALALVALLAGHEWLAERPLLADALAGPAMYLPVVLLAWRTLLAPAGVGPAAAFGLIPRAGEWRPALLMTAALTGAGVVLDLVLGLLGGWLALDSHWSEWFDADLAWGPTFAVALTLLATVVVAPLFEEVIFRGLLFGSLRGRLGPWPAAVLSALLFGLAHGYGATGFASVFVSGVLWAWAYERTGSLLPAIAAHALNNAAVGVTLLWLLR